MIFHENGTVEYSKLDGVATQTEEAVSRLRPESKLTDADATKASSKSNTPVHSTQNTPRNKMGSGPIFIKAFSGNLEHGDLSAPPTAASSPKMSPGVSPAARIRKKYIPKEMPVQPAEELSDLDCFGEIPVSKSFELRGTLFMELQCESCRCYQL